MTLRDEIQDLALRCLRQTLERSADGYANASQAQRALKLLGLPISLGALTRLCNLNGIPIRQGGRAGPADPHAGRRGRKPVGLGHGTTYSPHRKRAWELRQQLDAEGRPMSMQRIADILGAETGRTFTKQGIAKLLERPPEPDDHKKSESSG